MNDCFFMFFFSSRRRHTRCSLVTGVQTCALPIYRLGGERLAVIHGEDRLTWSELACRVTRRANAMLAQDVGKDDIVTISLPNCNALYEIAFACWKTGATPSLVS